MIAGEMFSVRLPPASDDWFPRTTNCISCPVDCRVTGLTAVTFAIVNTSPAATRCAAAAVQPSVTSVPVFAQPAVRPCDAPLTSGAAARPYRLPVDVLRHADLEADRVRPVDENGVLVLRRHQTRIVEEARQRVDHARVRARVEQQKTLAVARRREIVELAAGVRDKRDVVRRRAGGAGHVATRPTADCRPSWSIWFASWIILGLMIRSEKSSTLSVSGFDRRKRRVDMLWLLIVSGIDVSV